MQDLIDAFFNGGAGNKRIIELEAENKHLKKEVARYEAAMREWMGRASDLSRRLGKMKIQLIDLQIQDRN